MEINNNKFIIALIAVAILMGNSLVFAKQNVFFLKIVNKKFGTEYNSTMFENEELSGAEMFINYYPFIN